MPSRTRSSASRSSSFGWASACMRAKVAQLSARQRDLAESPRMVRVEAFRAGECPREELSRNDGKQRAEQPRAEIRDREGVLGSFEALRCAAACDQGRAG